MRRGAWTLVVLVLLAGAPAQAAPVHATILAINDLHGNLEPPPGGVRVADPAHPGKRVTIAAGGVARMATLLKQLRARHPGAAFVAAGDLIGASPLLSGLFHDEPTVAALSRMGLEASAVGNHEFDAGAAALLRLQKGARFHYLAANVVKADGTTLLPPYYIRRFDGVPVAFIGVVLQGAARIVAPAGVAGLSFRDEAASVNALVPELKARGIEAIVVLIHQGGEAGGGRNACQVRGPILDIVKRLDKAVDVVVSGHTHQAYNCVVDGRLLTSAHRYGTMVTEIDLTLDRKSHDVIAAKADNLLVRPSLKPDPAIAGLVARTERKAAPLANRIVGRLAMPLSRTAAAGGESAMGAAVADALLAGAPGAQIAFMNPGGIRAGLERAGPVTYGDLFTVLPFGNAIVTLDLTGAQLKAVLEQQWADPAITRILQVSNGFAYAWDGGRPDGDHVVPGSLMLDGAPIRPDATYRVAVPDYLAQGGDNMTVFPQGRNAVTGGALLAALEAWLRSPAAAGGAPAGRVRRIDVP
jgi:5'-nucleotidase